MIKELHNSIPLNELYRQKFPFFAQKIVDFPIESDIIFYMIQKALTRTSRLFFRNRLKGKLVGYFSTGGYASTLLGIEDSDCSSYWEFSKNINIQDKIEDYSSFWRKGVEEGFEKDNMFHLFY